jgi:hypothetical protein
MMRPVSASARKTSTENRSRSEMKATREPSGLSAGPMFSRPPVIAFVRIGTPLSATVASGALALKAARSASCHCAESESTSTERMLRRAMNGSRVRAALRRIGPMFYSP